MSTADKDGRLARRFADMHICLGMALADHARTAAADFEDAMARVEESLAAGPSEAALASLRALADAAPLRWEGDDS